MLHWSTKLCDMSKNMHILVPTHTMVYKKI